MSRQARIDREGPESYNIQLWTDFNYSRSRQHLGVGDAWSIVTLELVRLELPGLVNRELPEKPREFRQDKNQVTKKVSD